MADDDLNIFEEFYESVKPGGTFDQRALDVGKTVTDVLTPSDETKAEMESYDKQRQDALNLLLSAAGVSPDSFEGRALETKFRQNKDLQKLLGFEGNMLKDLKYDFAKAGQFLFGDANVGLTSMKEQGTKFKDLPFEQKFGIAMLPIDALDLVGLGVLAKGGLSPLIKTGMKVYGKKSGKTIQDLLSDEQVLKAIEAEQPGFMRELDDTLGGGIIQKRFMTGRTKGPVGGKPEEVIDSPTTTAKQNVLEQKKQSELEAESIRQTTKAAEEAQTKLNNFVDEYNKIFSGSKGNVARNLRNFAARTGEAEYNRLFALAEKQNLLLKGPGSGGARTNVLSGEALDFIKNNMNLSNEDLAKAINKNPEKYILRGTEVTPKQVQRFIGANKIKSPGNRPMSTDKRTKSKVEKVKTIYDEMMESDAYDINNQADKTEAFIKSFRQAEGKTDESIFTQSKISEQLKRRIKQYNKANPDDPILTPREIADLRIETARREFDTSNTFETYLRNDKRLQKLIDDGFLNEKNKESMVRFINFIRRSDPEFRGRKQSITNPNIFNNFLDKKFSELANDLSNKDSIFYKNFSEFVKVDEIRKVLSPTKQMLKNKSREFLNIKPFLDRIFLAPENKIDNVGRIVKSRNYLEQIEDAKNSVNIAHRFEGAEIGKTVSEDLAGAFELPSSYNLDLSIINSVIQPSLERRARRAIKAGDTEELQLINKEATDVGTEFIINGRKFGKQLSLQEKLQSLVAPYMGESGKRLQKEHNITNEMIENVLDAINLLEEASKQIRGAPQNLQRGGLLTEDMNIFDDEEKGQIIPKITVEFGDAALGRARRFGEDKPEEVEPMQVQRVSAAPQEKVFDTPPIENIFTGEVQEANLKLPFFKLFTKPPVNETAPIPTPKEALDNPTKKQLQSLEQEKLNKEQDFFDPTPEDNAKVDLGSSTDVATTPKTNQPLTGVFYSDAEKVLQRPDTPVIFPNKQALIDFFAKNRIKKTELEDYGINNLLKAFDEVTPIPKDAVIRQIRSAPVRGMHVHGTGKGSEIINPSGEKVNVAYEGYREDGFIPGTTSERVLYIPMDKLPGDTAGQPVTIFAGETIQNHGFGLPGGSDNNYVIGWTRLSERRAILPTKLGAPTDKSKIPGLTRERERAQRQIAGLYAEAINKLNREGVRRGFDQRELERLSQLSLEQIMLQYGDTMNELSPGLLDQIDDLIVKVRDLDTQITKASSVDASNVVKVQFADEIQSDIMQAAAGRKQKLLATLRKLQEEGRESTTLPELNRIGNEALAFFEKNKSVFRPLKKSQTEVDIFADSLAKVDAEVDDIINRFVETREISDTEIARVKSLLNDQIDEMINDLITVDQNTYEGLFPDLPFKKREEWADALIKKDLFELAYRKFVLKDPDVPDYYAVTPDKFVIDRYSFTGNTSTSAADRAADKADQIKAFTERGEFKGSKFKGIGMSEFYGGPNAVDEKGKHYTSTIEKILKTQAKSNNSEMIILNVQTKSGGSDIYRITDQNGNMVATLTDARQVQMIRTQNPNYNVEAIRVPDMKNTTPSFAIKITEEMLEPYKTHKAKGGLVEMIDIFEVT